MWWGVVGGLMVATIAPYTAANSPEMDPTSALDPESVHLYGRYHSTTSPGSSPSSSSLSSTTSEQTYHGYPGAMNVCPPCDIRKCATVTPDACDGQIVKDECNCCPVCDIEEDPEEIFIKPHASSQNNSCESVTCPRNEICIVNIQSIPMCRCPTAFWCKHGVRRPLCSEEGVTYKSRCYLKIDECTTGRKIKIKHKGNCGPQRVKPSKEDKLKIRADRRKERKKEKQVTKQWKQQNLNKRQIDRHSDRQHQRQDIRQNNRKNQNKPRGSSKRDRQKLQGRIGGRKNTKGKRKRRAEKV